MIKCRKFIGGRNEETDFRDIIGWSIISVGGSILATEAHSDAEMGNVAVIVQTKIVPSNDGANFPIDENILEKWIIDILNEELQAPQKIIAAPISTVGGGVLHVQG